MIRKDLVNKVSESTGVEPALVDELIRSTLNTIKNSLISGENVYLRGFGSFFLAKKKSRKGTDFVRGIQVEVPAHFFPDFSPAIELKERVKELPISCWEVEVKNRCELGRMIQN